MIYELILAITLVVAFFMSILSFIWGCKVGKSLSNGVIPTVNLNPIKAYKEHKTVVADKKETDLLQQGYDNMMSYDGSIPEERK